MTLFALQDLQVSFQTPAGTAHAVRGVDLAVRRGEILGLVGESGSGKSALFLASLGLAGPRARVDGRALFEGENLIGLSDRALSAIRGRRVSMVFQDPASSLNPVATIGRQLDEAIGLNRPAATEAPPGDGWPTPRELLAEVDIPDPARRLRAYPHELSGGQNQRVMIAMMLAGAPDLLIADEPTTALDVTVQAQILDLLKRISRSRGMSIVLVSHDLGVVAQICDTIAVMYAGRIVEQGPVMQVFDAPRHPYTAGLMASRPGQARTGRLMPIEGNVPSPFDPAPGCAFAPRCARRREACMSRQPPQGSGPHRWRCFNPIEDLAAAS
ncbi:MAG: ABC transporter ATP-binding protein [Kiloniellales bacterium]|nr:ABC transporter ATP-binding protein [Kiloniellales bacterium]